MNPNFLRRSVVILALIACGAATHAADITADTTWTGDIKVAEPTTVRGGTLSIDPGTTITFAPGSSLTLLGDTTLKASGQPDKPIRFVGQSCGSIFTVRAAIALEYCSFDNVGPQDGNPKYSLQSVGGDKPFSLHHCQFTNSRGINADTEGAVEVSDCDFKQLRSNVDVGGGTVNVAGNTFQQCSLWVVSNSVSAAIHDNVVLDGTLMGPAPQRGKNANLIVESNYVRNHINKQTYGLQWFSGAVKNNLIRGGTWCSAFLGGTVSGNVLEAFSQEENDLAAAAGNKDHTHEQLYQADDGTVIRRNIFINASYGAIMSGDKSLGNGWHIENNTFDLHGQTPPVYLNHLTASGPKDLVVRNNLFLRTGSLLDEKSYPDSFSNVDFNLWAQLQSPSRYDRVVMSRKRLGEPGYSGSDVPAYTESDPGKLDVKSIIINPDFKFPFTDEQMLKREHTVKEAIELYRAAYTLLPDSPAIDAGDKAVIDPSVTDGKPDLGALEWQVPTGKAKPATTRPVTK